jgi:diacylglycerol kinase
MIKFSRSRLQSIRFALEGWWYVISTQRNTWIHSVASIAVIAIGFWLKLSFQEWAVIILAIALVWVVEIINTSLEVLIDLISPQHSELAKISKDVSAAAVLISAVSSVIIGLLILGPPLYSKLQLLANLFAQ